MKNEMNRNFTWNAIGSTFNSFNSLFFLIIVTRINGLEDAGIFSYAFAMSVIFYVIAIYSGRTYQVTEANKDISRKDYIIHRAITCTVMLVVSLGFVILNRYDIYKSSIFLLICLFRCIEAFSDVFYGILQKNDQLNIVGKSLFMKAILGLAFFIAVDILTKNVVIACIGICVINVVLFLTYDLKYVMRFLERNWKVKRENIMKIFQLGLFTFLFTMMSLYVVNAPRYAIDRMLSSDSQAIFGIIAMPSTVMILFGSFITHPFLTKLLEKYLSKDKKGFLKIINRLILAIVLCSLVAIVLAYFAGISILELIYGIVLGTQLNNLLMMICGATMYTIGVVISNVLITMRRTGVQLGIYGVTAVFGFYISNILVSRNGLDGGVQSYLFVMLIQMALYISALMITLKMEER